MLVTNWSPLKCGYCETRHKIDRKFGTAAGGIGGVVGVFLGPALLRDGRVIELIALAVLGAIAVAFAMWLWTPGRAFTQEELSSFLEAKKKPEPRDPFDYKKYSDEELIDVYKHIDRSAYPERFQKIQSEMEKRKNAEPDGSYNSSQSLRD